MKQGPWDSAGRLSSPDPDPDPDDAEATTCSWVGTSAGMEEEAAQVGISAGTAEGGMAQGISGAGTARGISGAGTAQGISVADMARGISVAGRPEVAGRAACTVAADKTSFWSRTLGVSAAGWQVGGLGRCGVAAVEHRSLYRASPLHPGGGGAPQIGPFQSFPAQMQIHPEPAGQELWSRWHRLQHRLTGSGS